MLIPAFLASRTTIVLHKQRRSRSAGAPFWKKAFLDVLLLAVSGYGFYSYKTQQKVLAITGVKSGDLPMDPPLFVISTLFILGLGLVILRLYPYLVRFVFWIGRRIWTPDLYATFIHVGRSLGQEQFLMIFLILTLSIGILNAKAARTVNRNLEEKVRYSTGADVSIQEKWPSDQPAGSGAPEDPMAAAGGAGTATPVYREPDFNRFVNLDGVELATKVFRKTGAFAGVGGGKTTQVYLMGIVPHEFGKVSWFRADLLPYHWNQYLNLLAQSPKALLVSTSFASKYQLKPGDPVEITWANQSYLDGVIYGIVDYWPTYNPHAKGSDEYLVVANFNYVQAKMALEPYEVWLKKKPGATSEGLYRGIEDLKMDVASLSDAGQEIIKQKNDPMLQGTNGALTLGFILTMMISTIGFLIYWIISIQSRVLQFGIFRAMGLSRGRLAAMLFWEQVLISGIAIVLGLSIGGVTSDLFVPLLQLTSSAAQQVPPYRVVASADDYVKLYAFIAVMLVAAFAVLGAIISRIRISQAIKLGEE
jgi:putative ABC transport system permease protein